MNSCIVFIYCVLWVKTSRLIRCSQFFSCLRGNTIEPLSINWEWTVLVVFSTVWLYMSFVCIIESICFSTEVRVRWAAVRRVPRHRPARDPCPSRSTTTTTSVRHKPMLCSSTLNSSAWLVLTTLAHCWHNRVHTTTLPLLIMIDDPLCSYNKSQGGTDESVNF